MATKIEMPELSSDGEGATLAAWLVSIGDRVEKGDVIAELETDKATVELESPATGIVLEFVMAEGAEGILPGTLLATLDGVAEAEDDEPATSPENTKPTPREAGAESQPAPVSLPTSTLRESTPLARRTASQRDVDLSSVAGSGPGGRVVVEDVLRTADSARTIASPAVAFSNHPGPPEVEITDSFETVRLSSMRKTIARRMTESKQQIPHFYLRMRCPMDNLMAARGKINEQLRTEGRDTKISVNDFIVRAAALALRVVPAANVQFAGDVMHVFDRIDVAVAVATDGGLVTPVVRNADRKGLALLATEIKELAVLAREGKLRAEQVQAGTFTISNLGMYGVETVYPILNPPQACILGVGAAEQQPVVRNGAIEIGHIASLTLAADHRAVDGAIGAQLLAAICERLTDPLRLML